MRKSILTRINLLLGALIILLTGCKTQKNVNNTNGETDSPAPSINRPEDRPVCLYGIPPEVYKEMQEREQRDQEPQQDSIK